MRVRIVRLPRFDGWAVEKKYWWEIWWTTADSFYGDNAEELAIKYARSLKYPCIVEIE